MSQNPEISASQTQSHTRVINTVLGPLEKRALLWLAARMPAWVVPDTLTFIGLFASVVILAGYGLTYFHMGFLWLASFGFIIQWFGDSLDGTLARYRKIERPRYGFFVDHIIDSVSEVLVFIGIGLSPFVRFDLALLALIAYLLLSTYVYLVTYVNGIFRISYAYLGPTEMRALAVIVNTVIFFTGNAALNLFGFTGTIFDGVAIVFILAAMVIFAVNSIQTAMTLSVEDRARARAQSMQRRAAKIARRQALRDERAMRKATARTAKRSKGSRTWHIPQTGPIDE